MPIILSLTDAGEAAVQGASGADPIVIAELGLSDTPFVMAPTLVALPGEFKRINALAGEAVAPNITTMSAYDTSADVWDATGFGLFLDDGTLFATYSSPDPVLSKASLAFALISFDVAWSADLAANIDFGNPIFTSPPATETVRGIIEISTQAEADAGASATLALPPAYAKAALPNWLTGAMVLAKLLTVDGSGSGIDADLLDGQNGSWYADIAARLGYVPLATQPGKVEMFAMAAAPAGYLACDGAAVSRATYAALFAAIGTTWGVGDGATTFNLPDLRGEFVRGFDDGRGVDPGRAFASAQADELKAHEHAMFTAATSGANITGGAAHAAWSSGSSSGNQDYDIKGTAGAPTLGLTGEDGGSETRPRNIALLFCIKT